MNNPNWAVRIVAVPPGEAPLWVSQKWVGLDLPVMRYAAHRKMLAFGVLSIPQSWPAQWAAILRGRAERVAGYVVAAAPAIGILAKASPEAAAVAREHAASDRAEALPGVSRRSLPDCRHLTGY
ncbi:hypothetical protein ACO2JO_07285 [Leptospira interrogans]